MSTPDKPKKRPPCPLKHPRYYDKKHGFTQVEDLFVGLTPKGWEPPRVRSGEDEESD